MLFVATTLCLGFVACGDDDEPDPKPSTPDENPLLTKIAGTWVGEVHYDDGYTDGEVKVVLKADGSYSDYNEHGQLVGEGKYSYDGNTITVPAGCFVASDWGTSYTVTISGSKMTWTNSTMQQYHKAEYRFTKR